MLQVYGAFPWIGLAAFPILIYGTSRMLLSGLVGVQLLGTRLLGRLPALFALVGILLHQFNAVRGGNAWADGLWLWSLGMVLHVALTIGSVARHARRRSGLLPMAGRRLGPALYPGATAVLYGLSAAVVAPLWSLGILPLPVLVHLHLTGFVVGTMVAASILLLPRFTDVRPPPWASWTIAILPIPGPALLAMGFLGHPRMFRLGAMVEAIAMIAFAAYVGWQLLRSPRRRASFVPFALSLISLVAAVLLGLAFAHAPVTQVLVPLHAALNLVGFVGLFVLAAAWDLFAPSIGRGVEAYRIQGVVLAVLVTEGWALFIIAYHASPWLSQLGLLLLLVAFAIVAIGSWASWLRITRAKPGGIGRVPPPIRAG